MARREKKNSEGSEASTPASPRRLPPIHQGTLDESIARLGLRGVTMKRMFGGLCYYAEGSPFAFLLGASLALKLPAVQLREGCTRGEGTLFHPGDGDFVMREYLDLDDSALLDEGRVDAYVQESYRFVAGQKAADEDLDWGDLLQGRDELYRRVGRKPVSKK